MQRLKSLRHGIHAAAQIACPFRLQNTQPVARAHEAEKPALQTVGACPETDPHGAFGKGRPCSILNSNFLVNTVLIDLEKYFGP
jgi:hypothetical protein